MKNISFPKFSKKDPKKFFKILNERVNNYFKENKIMNWFSGGLNFQVEHHLFPNICHIHYKKLSEIVKKTASEFQLPYNEYKTTREAIKSHFIFLKSMAKKPVIV